MAVLGESHSKGELGINEVHLNTRVQLGCIGWSLENRQLSRLVEGQLLDGLSVELDLLSNPDQLISSSESESGCLLSIMESSHSNSAQPSVVIISHVRNEESIHLKVVVSEKVEDGVVATLEGVAKQLSFRQPNGKVRVRATHVHKQMLICVEQKIANE